MSAETKQRREAPPQPVHDSGEPEESCDEGTRVSRAGEATGHSFAWNLDEISGALGDLGTFLPHIIGVVAVVGMDPTGILTTFGLFYAFAGAFYGVPKAVQPMKAASAAVLITPLDPGAVAGAGLVIGAFFLVAGATGLVSRIARILPLGVAAGLQLGLGLSLAALGVRLVEKQLWLGIAMSAAMLVLVRIPRMPVALVAVIAGAVIGQMTGITSPLPKLDFGLHLPHFVLPTRSQILHGIEYAVLPQIPLTLTNAIIVTAVVVRQLFPDGHHRVSERNLAITTGLGNLLSAPFGGFLMCHGAGGVMGHYRFGASTATTPLLKVPNVTSAEYEETHPVRVELDRHHYEGTYRLMTGTVIVYLNGDVKFALHGRDRPELVARWLLTDL